MTVLTRADEIVVRAVQPGAHFAEQRRVPVRKLRRRDPQVTGGLDHLQAMLVGAGQKEHVISVEPLEPCDRIGRNGLVGVADMRLTVGIGDRGRDVKGGFVAHGVACGCLDRRNV